MAAAAASRAAPAARVRSKVKVTVPGRRTAVTRSPDPVSGTSILASAPASGSSSAGGAVSPPAGSATAAAGDSSRSSTALRSSSPPGPSVSAWWARRYSATRPSSRPSIRVASHGGRSGSNGRGSSSASRSRSWRRPPGAETAMVARWARGSTSGTSIQAGRALAPLRSSGRHRSWCTCSAAWARRACSASGEGPRSRMIRLPTIIRRLGSWPARHMMASTGLSRSCMFPPGARGGQS